MRARVKDMKEMSMEKAVYNRTVYFTDACPDGVPFWLSTDNAPVVPDDDDGDYVDAAMVERFMKNNRCAQGNRWTRQADSFAIYGPLPQLWNKLQEFNKKLEKLIGFFCCCCKVHLVQPTFMSLRIMI